MEKIRIFALQIEQPVIKNKTFVAYENYWLTLLLLQLYHNSRSMKDKSSANFKTAIGKHSQIYFEVVKI